MEKFKIKHFALKDAPQKDRPFFKTLISKIKKGKGILQDEYDGELLVQHTPPARTASLLDFAASAFPEKFEISIENIPVTIEKTGTLLTLKRKKNKLTIEFYTGFGSDLEQVSINPQRVFFHARKKIKDYGFKKIEWDYEGNESTYRGFIVEINGKENVAEHYKKGLERVENLLLASIGEVRKEIAAGRI